MSIDKLKTKFFTGAWLTDVKHYFSKINEIIDYLNGTSGNGSYKVYSALLSQSGTNPPTAIILQNTLGYTPTYNYDDVGQYSITLSNAPYDKIFVTPSTLYSTPITNDRFTMIEVDDDNSIIIISKTASTDTFANHAFPVRIPIEIRVYN